MTLKRLVQRLGLMRGDQLYLLGDYIDRGPNSKGVLDYLMSLQKRAVEVVVLRGNHEQLMLDAISYPLVQSTWLQVGGVQTLKSFGVARVKDIPEVYLRFVESLELYHELSDYFLVHAGLDTTQEDPLSDEWSLLNIREFTLDPGYLKGKILVRGHVPTMLPKIQDDLRKTPNSSILTIDNGCVYSEVWGLGNLIAMDLNTRELTVQPCIDEIGWYA